GGGNQSSSGQITINGGKITAKGGTNAAGIGGGKDESGTITINGGFIIATSQYNNATPGAAIGGGNNGNGTVTINGGHIIANGGQSAAGIGSGYAASATVIINAGNIEAHGGQGAAGIGSGKYWNDTSTTRQATVFIHGGTVVADTISPSQNTDGSAAIGGGAHSQGFVTIDGGHITATAPKNCTCIGNYEVNYQKTGAISITGGVVIAQLDSSVQASDNYYGIGGVGSTVILGWTNTTDSITAPAWGTRSNMAGSSSNNNVSFSDGKNFQYSDTHEMADTETLRQGSTLIPLIQSRNIEQAVATGVRSWYPYTGDAIKPEPEILYDGTLLTKGTHYNIAYSSDSTAVGEKSITITGISPYTGIKTINYKIVEATAAYLDVTGSKHNCSDFQCLDQSDVTLSTGWYYVYDDLTINDRITLSGDVNLILKDGKTLTARKGISVPTTTSLTIYAQSDNETTAGKLETGTPEVSLPGIGGTYRANTAVTPGDITIVGGVINATGGVGAAAVGGATFSSGGNISIKGGFVTAQSSVGGGAAIGGGANADGGTITISDGKVTATSNGGAAIGGGSNGKSGTINIYGGTINATASGDASIGGGSNGAGETINILGGTITAVNTGESGGAAIGGGMNAAGGKITIEKCTINATSKMGAGIGGGGQESSGETTIIIGSNATISEAVSHDGAGIGSGNESGLTCSVTIRNGAKVTAGSINGAGIGSGSDALASSVFIQGDNTEVNAWANGFGIRDAENNLSAYGGAAIGGGKNVSGGTITISGGTVTARAIGGGAGIGSGANIKANLEDSNDQTDGGNITISGGEITATATHHAAGIGGGRRSNGGNITISGGTIVSNGSDASGIGHGGSDSLWEGQGTYHIPVVTDPSENSVGAWYDSIASIENTQYQTTDGTITFTYEDGGDVSITANSYPGTVTLSKPFMYLDTLGLITQQPISDGKTIIPSGGETWTISFDQNGGSGEMANAHVIKNSSYELPACGFSAQNGKVFKEWSVNIGNAEAVTYMPGSMITVTADTTVKAIWDIVPIFRSHALLLSGEIGVKFRVAFPAGFNPEGCYMEFKAADGRTDTVQYADAETITGSDDRYFNFNINALELAEDITATLHYSTDETVVNNYSAMTYIQYVQQNVTNNRSLINLINALQSYGYYMQQSGWTDDKATHTEIPAPATLLTDSDITAARTNVSWMNFVKSLDGSGIENARFSLTLNAKTVINFLVKPGEGVNVTTAGYKTKTINGETYYQYTTEKIGPRNLGRSYSVTIETNNGTATVSAPAMAYVKLALNDSNLDTNKKKAMTAYYKYYYAAANYSE
ncbi:MAG: hypothetical protein IK078_09430, partial [Lachnospiraceae bacterium]|nr:hypothetical protein [Lachnospiraceae bacterium]